MRCSKCGFENPAGAFNLFRCESILLQSYWVMVVMDIFTRRIIGFGVAPANLGVMPPPLQCCENQH